MKGHFCDPDNPGACINADGSYCQYWERAIGVTAWHGVEWEDPTAEEALDHLSTSEVPEMRRTRNPALRLIRNL